MTVRPRAGLFALMLFVNLTACTDALLQKQGVTSFQALTANLNRGIDLRESAKNQTLLYTGSYLIYILTYPEGKLVTSFLPDQPTNGMCSDNHGDVFTTASSGDYLAEYSHGSTQPIGNLSVPNAIVVWGCTVDPSSGDLAATVNCLSSCDTEVAIFRKAKGTPKVYPMAKSPQLRFPGYDGSGNLFIDGVPVYGGSAFAELPKDKNAVIQIGLPVKLKRPGQVQWDGKYLALQDRLADTIYRLKISHGTATVAATVNLAESHREQSAWIRDGRIVVPYQDNNQGPPYVGVWDYPTGGAPVQTINEWKSGDGPFNGITISVPPKQ